MCIWSVSSVAALSCPAGEQELLNQEGGRTRAAGSLPGLRWEVERRGRRLLPGDGRRAVTGKVAPGDFVP